MTQVKSAPALARLNGCGVGLYGKRDFDAETGTHVATWCVSLLFVPVLCLRAYRVAKSPRGWYFLGREPLSPIAKWWNIALLAGIAFIAGGLKYNAYVSSPAYKAQRQMASAQNLIKAGHLTEGARIYQTLALAGADQSDQANTALADLIDNGCAQAPLTESAGAFASAAQVARRGNAIPAAHVAAAGLKLAAQKGDADPRGGVAMLDAIRPLVIDTRDIDAKRMALLRKWAASDPANLDVLVPLASLLEQQDQLPEAKKLLLPVKDRLGDGEGARVLGTILGREGDLDGAYAVLWPYVKTRLDRLHEAEKNSNDTLSQIWDREVDLLKNDKGPEDFYARYKNASSDAQKTMVREYINGRIKDDPQFAAVQQALERESAVVPVALELGIVMLQRAQGQANAEARKSQLEGAEQVFLAIGGVAGETDEYRLSLGQVYYWLGKQADGRKLFDDYLTSKGRGFAELMNIAHRLRQLGSVPEARTLAEEAYGKGNSDEQHQAALFRSVISKDSDDSIAWLNKSDLAEPIVKASLAKALGTKAFEEGRDDEAVRQFHAAIDAYAAMPRSETTLNETALAQYAIYSATGDQQAFDKCVDCFQQAVELDPTDTVLRENAGMTLLGGALTGLIGSDIDLRALHASGNTTLLGYLYKDQPGREALIKRVKEHPGVARALSYLQKVMVMSPKDSLPPAVMYSVYRFTRDDAALQSLEQRLRAAEIDTADDLAHVKEFLDGSKDQQNQSSINASLKRSADAAAALVGKGGVTAAVALDEQVDQWLALDSNGGTIDADKVVALAEQAHQLAPSEATYGRLNAAYLYRASVGLRRSDPAFDEFYNKYKRSIGTTYLMAVAASEPGPLQQKVLENPDTQKAIAIMRADTSAYPEGASIYEWAMLKNADAKAAGNIAVELRKRPRESVEQSIANLLNPVSADEALDTYWLGQILGKPEDGKAALHKVAGMGIPIPIQP